jgi:hypothetical protein
MMIIIFCIVDSSCEGSMIIAIDPAAIHPLSTGISSHGASRCGISIENSPDIAIPTVIDFTIELVIGRIDCNVNAILAGGAGVGICIGIPTFKVSAFPIFYDCKGKIKTYQSNHI